MIRRLVGAAALMASPAVVCASAGDVVRPRLQAGMLDGTLRVDGVLDEPAWTAAPEAAPLVMVEPRPGEVPTAPTVVKVLAGPHALVFGIRCHDPEPAGIVSFTKERDGDFDSEDHVAILLDPFQDGRSGYVFAVNPGAARFDALRRGLRPGGGHLGRDGRPSNVAFKGILVVH